MKNCFIIVVIYFLCSIRVAATDAVSTDGLSAEIKIILQESFGSTIINPQRQEFTVNSLKEMKAIEDKFTGLDIDTILQSKDYAKMDEIKNDFIKYDNNRYNINEIFKWKKNAANYVKDEDAFSLQGLEYPMPDQSFSDSAIFQKLKKSLSSQNKDQLAVNVVYRKFKTFLYNAVPVIDGMIAAKVAEANKIAEAKEAEADKKRKKHEKVLDSPNCNKIAKFEEYCGRRRGEASMKLAFENEKKLNSRSGTVRPAAMRGYNAELMNYESQLAQMKKEFNSIKSSVISLNDCQVIRNKEVDVIDFVFAPKLVARLKEAFKKYCEVEWNEN